MGVTHAGVKIRPDSPSIAPAIHADADEPRRPRPPSIALSRYSHTSMGPHRRSAHHLSSEKKNTCFCGNHALNMTIAICLARLDEKVHKCIVHDLVQCRAGAFRISNMKPTASASRIKPDCSCPHRHVYSIYLLKMEISESGESLWAQI